jgi:hypothetical protein
MKTVNIFVGVDMRGQHRGLSKLALEKGVDLRSLKDCEAVVFISRDRMRIKTVSYNGVLAFIKAADRKRPFDLSSVDEFARAFNPDGTMDYAKALRSKLIKTLSKNRIFEDMELL